MPLFTSRIAIIGANPYVTPPPAVLRAIFAQARKTTSPIPVRGRILALRPKLAPDAAGAPFQQTLMRYLGAWRLYLNGPMLKQAGGVAPGDRVRVELAFDPAPRTYPMPRAFKRALALPKNRRARAAFLALTPSHQKEINRYLGFAKTEATLKRNIAIVLGHLKGEKQRTLGAVMRVGRSRPSK